MSSNIPEARHQLRLLADQLRSLQHPAQADRIEEIVNDLMTRSFNGRKAPTRSRTVTPGLASKIRRYAKRHPTASQHDIASHFNVNPGRVSEVLSAK